MSFAQDLCHIIAQSDAFMALLRAVRDIALPQGCVGAGALRSLVWDSLHNRRGWSMPSDIDVAYFDPADLSEAAQAGYLARLQEHSPGVPWEVVNQAGVHRWYGQHFGTDVPPLASLEAAIATWPEYATCVAVRLTAEGQLDIVAPYGLDDLFSMTIRHNPARVSVTDYRRRVQAKRYTERWPNVTVILE